MKLIIDKLFSVLLWLNNVFVLALHVYVLVL